MRIKIEEFLAEEVPTPLVEFDYRVRGWPLSKLFFCAQCSHVYAHVFTGRSWHAVYGCCRNCTAAADLTVPGSIWTYEDWLVDSFPASVLRLELERHCDWFEQQGKKYD